MNNSGIEHIYMKYLEKSNDGQVLSLKYFQKSALVNNTPPNITLAAGGLGVFTIHVKYFQLQLFFHKNDK